MYVRVLQLYVLTITVLCWAEKRHYSLSKQVINEGKINIRLCEDDEAKCCSEGDGSDHQIFSFLILLSYLKTLPYRHLKFGRCRLNIYRPILQIRYDYRIDI